MYSCFLNHSIAARRPLLVVVPTLKGIRPLHLWLLFLWFGLFRSSQLKPRLQG